MTIQVAKSSSGSTTILVSNATSVVYEFYKFMNSLSGIWYISASSDGTAVAGGFDPLGGAAIKSASSGSLGMSNNLSWFVLTQGSSTSGNAAKSFCFQRGNGDNLFRIKYSASAGFISGGSAQQVPSAPDEKVILGSGTDASPGFAQLFRVSSGAQINCHFVCDTTSRGWVMFGNEFNSGSVSFFHTFDPVSTTNTGDADASVIVLDNSTSSATASVDFFNGNKGKLWCWYNKGLSSERFDNLQAFDPSSANVQILGSSYSLPTSPYTLKDGMMPVIYGRRANSTPAFPSGIKGQSSLLKWHLQNGRPNYYGFTALNSSTNANENRLVIGNISIPWDVLRCAPPDGIRVR